MAKTSLVFAGLLVGSGTGFSQSPVPIPTVSATVAPTPAATALVTPAATPKPTATPVPAKSPAAAPVTVNAQTYRSTLQRELANIKALEKAHPRPLGPILKRLDKAFIVKRPDGKTQQVNGNTISRFFVGINKPADATKEEVSQAAQIVESQLEALDEWLAKPAYTSVDAKKVIGNLESSGQIRTGPLWWQKAMSDALKWLGSIWKSFTDWLNSLLPKPKGITPPKVGTPRMEWLWIFFYGLVGALLVAIAWYLYHAFGGSWGRRSVKREAVLQGEDAQLLLLPPEELRSRAEIYASQGNFPEALRHRYLALLLQLDSRGVWRYDTRRTNWEHIAALRRRENTEVLVAPLSALTRRFDRVRYGGAPCDEEQWRQYDSDARHFEVVAAPLERSVEVSR